MRTEEGGRGATSHTKAQRGQRRRVKPALHREELIYFISHFFPCVPCIPWLVILFIMRNEPRNTQKAQKGSQLHCAQNTGSSCSIYTPPMSSFILPVQWDANHGTHRKHRKKRDVAPITPIAPITSRRRKPAFCCCFAKICKFLQKAAKIYMNKL